MVRYGSRISWNVSIGEVVRPCRNCFQGGGKVRIDVKLGSERRKFWAGKEVKSARSLVLYSTLVFVVYIVAASGLETCSFSNQCNNEFFSCDTRIQIIQRCNDSSIFDKKFL